MITVKRAQSCPRVSILLPNLNKAPFIAERIESIREQVLQDWECVIVDSYSDDGSREALMDFAESDGRVMFHSAPRDGIYPNWNRALEKASGDYVYIATSDDTMYPECLVTCVGVLDEYPEVDLCAFRVVFIDEASIPCLSRWEDWPTSHYYGKWLHRRHFRERRFELLRLFVLGPVHHSMTGLLIRRSLFEKTGPFPATFGYAGDYAWQFEAMRYTDTIYLPKALATFRKYAEQATGAIPDWRERASRIARHFEGDLEEKEFQRVKIALSAHVVARDIKPARPLYAAFRYPREMLLMAAQCMAISWRWPALGTFLYRLMVPLKGLREI